MSKSIILYTGSFRFPNKDAASQRVLGIAKALRKTGNEIIFCGWEKTPRSQDKINEEYIYQGFKYYSQAELDLPKRHLYKRILDYFTLGDKTLEWIKRYTLTHKITHIIVYNSNSIFILRLKKFCNKNQIKLICDCTEWYDGRQLPGGRFGIGNIDNNFRIRILYPIVKNVIVISTYLKKYLDLKNCCTIVIPPLVDFEESKWHNSQNSILNDTNIPIKLIYAGDPGKKDLLFPIIEALDKFNIEKIKIELSIVGLDRDHFLKYYYSNSHILPKYIKCVGRVPLDDVPQYYFNSHFSILIRENKRYANAGFPTKLVESLSAGVPVIINDTSDISKYVIHGQNGYILNNIKGQTIENILEIILRIKHDKVIQMKQKASKIAQECFDYKNYAHSLREYLEKC